jgi:hypothetical protein
VTAGLAWLLERTWLSDTGEAGDPRDRLRPLLAIIRRGPWGYVLEHHPDLAAAADWRMTSLAELPALVECSATR